MTVQTDSAVSGSSTPATRAPAPGTRPTNGGDVQLKVRTFQVIGVAGTADLIVRGDVHERTTLAMQVYPRGRLAMQVYEGGASKPDDHVPFTCGTPLDPKAAAIADIYSPLKTNCQI